MGNDPSVSLVAGMTVVPPIRGADMKFDIPPENGFVRGGSDDGIQEIRAGLQVPSARVFDDNLAPVVGEKRGGTESGIRPDTAKMPFRPGEGGLGNGIPDAGGGRELQCPVAA